jgi:hypothetical protein
MKGYLCLLLLVIAINASFGQTINTPPKKIHELKSIGDTYVVSMVIHKNILSEKCNCLFDKGEVCNLYEGSIKAIHLFPDKKTAFDSTLLSKVRFFLADSVHKLVENNAYTVTLSPATSNQYLRINTLLMLDSAQQYQFIHKGAYLSGFTSCYKISFFDKIFLKLGLIKPEGIDYQNKKRKKDKIDEFIKKLQAEKKL